mgnify:FL=1
MKKGIKEAKKIIDDFMRELDKIKFKGDFFVRRDNNVREECEVNNEKGFRERFLDNAPKIKNGFVMAEKKKW